MGSYTTSTTTPLLISTNNLTVATLVVADVVALALDLIG